MKKSIVPELLLLLWGGAGISLLFFRAMVSLFVPVLLIFVGWLLFFAGIFLFLKRTLSTPRWRILRERLAILFFGLLLGVVMVEWGLRWLNPFPRYEIMPANVRWETAAGLNRTPGIEGKSIYTTNDQGIRGDLYQAAGRYNILAIGGSTTETANLDDTEAWTYLLQAGLNAGNPPQPYWVGNVGRSGHGLVEHSHALAYFASQFDLDAVIMMVGVNDLGPILWQPDQYTIDYENPQNYPFYLHRSFYRQPLYDPQIPRSFPQNWAIWNLGYQLAWQKLLTPFPLQILQIDQAGNEFEEWRTTYNTSPQLTEFPEVTLALQLYEQNLHYLVQLADQQNLRLIFTTQPYVWHDQLSPALQQRLWVGHKGELHNPDGRYDMMRVAQAMDEFNAQLLAVCATTHAECVDLASAMNGQEGYFYDDVHFTEAGAEKVANELINYFEHSEP